jgi:hypothetical protein
MVLIPGQTRVIDVLTAVITAQREFIMTTSDPKTATLQAAPDDSASEPKATTKAHTAPRKPRVAPATAKAEKKTTPAKKGSQKNRRARSRPRMAKAPARAAKQRRSWTW